MEKLLAEQIEALKLEVQELRQFSISLVLGLRNQPLDADHCDFWWQKFTNYPPIHPFPVETDNS